MASLESTLSVPVVEKNVRYPQVSRMDHDRLHPSVLRLVPAHLVVIPHQIEPHAGGQQLVLLIL